MLTRPSRLAGVLLLASFASLVVPQAVLAQATQSIEVQRAGTQRLAGAISAVTVYPDRAFVTRDVKVALNAGVNEITVDDLPAETQPESLQVGGAGSAAFTLLDATIRTRYLDTAASPRVQELRAQIKALDTKLRALTDTAWTLEMQRNFVTELKPPSLSPSSGDAAGKVTASEVNALVSMMGEQLTRIVTELAKLATEKAALEEQRSALQEQLDKLAGGGNRRVNTALLRVEAKTSGTATLKVSYVVPGASWVPAYQVRARTDASGVELAYDALVSQSTGEDWKGVSLTLSTSRPALGGSAPDTFPWFVDVFTPPPPMAGGSFGVARSRAEKSAPAALMVADSALAPSENTSLGMAEAAVVSGLTSASFAITAPATIASDGSQQRVSVTRLDLAADLEHRTSPKLQPGAFLVAKTKNTSEFPLLPGSLAIFLDGTYASQAALGRVMPGEAFELALGADESVVVERTLLNRLNEVVGITQRTTRVGYDVAIAVTNKRKTPVKVLVRDVVPVSRNEKVVVKVTAPAEKDKSVTRGDQGRLEWTLNLKPGEKRTLPLQFSVEYPTDTPVTGVE